jgi:hypothetical protein
MLYLGIDQHKSQLTVNLRGEDGLVLLKRQVSTQWEKVRVFFADLAEKARPEGGFLAILEVCGMNPWLLEMLKQHGCREPVPPRTPMRHSPRRNCSRPIFQKFLSWPVNKNLPQHIAALDVTEILKIIKNHTPLMARVSRRNSSSRNSLPQLNLLNAFHVSL